MLVAFLFEPLRSKRGELPREILEKGDVSLFPVLRTERTRSARGESKPVGAEILPDCSIVRRFTGGDAGNDDLMPNTVESIHKAW